ncbi:MAG: hypothetical protein IKD08_00345 [Alphaproteobacteria bacterium]|nr:hypothetical protein [Alphaproteobacteria bacterium]
MNRTQKGSITVETIVMLGLIASLTPILYKHVADRRQDIENINEANVLLRLKASSLEYIETNKENISTGNTVLIPSDIGLEISGYQIGIRKEDDGTINAMIISDKAGNDFQAAKIASLIGISGGIYSAQDTEKAWGINGIWAEDITKYGFTSLPTGTAVITTAYEAENALDMSKIFSEIEEHEFAKLNAQQIKSDEFCLKIKGTDDYDCISSWDEDPIKIILQCNADLTNNVMLSSACQKGWNRYLNRSCEDIARKYREAGSTAISGLYAITTGENTRQERACYFVDGELPMPQELIIAVNTDAIARRYDWENGNISASCAKIISAWATAPTGFYTFVSGISTYQANQPCVFTGNRNATNGEVHTQCNNSASGSSAACQYAWLNDLNRSCNQIISSNPTAISKYYYINSTQTAANNKPCYFVDKRVATAKETITECNRVNVTENIACRYGYDNSYNNTCDNIIAYDSTRADTLNTVTAANSVSQQLCSICSYSIGEIVYQNNGTWSSSTYHSVNWSNSSFTVPANCAGNYTIKLAGGRGDSAGGISTITQNFSVGTKFTTTSLAGKQVDGWWSGMGALLYINGTLVTAAGGGHAGIRGGSGYQGGCGENYAGKAFNGYGQISGCTNNPNWAAGGSGTVVPWGGFGFGGSGYCAAGYTCQSEIAGNGDPPYLRIIYNGL